MPTTETRGPPRPSSRFSIVLLLVLGRLLRRRLLGHRLVALAERFADPVEIRMWSFGHLGVAYPAIAAPSRAAPSSSSAGVAVANETRSVLRRGSPA